MKWYPMTKPPLKSGRYLVTDRWYTFIYYFSTITGWDNIAKDEQYTHWQKLPKLPKKD